MITAPSAFKDALGAGNRNYQVLATVTLTSGSVLTLDNSVIWASGFSFEDAISTSADSLDIGAAIINQATLVISNMDEQFSDYDFDGATVAVQIGLRPDEDSSVSYINKGTFTVGKTAYNGTLITLTCLDNMSKFDKAYASPLTFPITAITVVQDACQACGVTLAVNSFDGDTTPIPEPPAEAVTYRQMLVWIGQMVGCCWRINNVGELAPVWYNISVLDQFYYDGGTFAYDNGDEYDGGTFAYNDGDSPDGGTFAQQAAYFSIHSASSESVAVDDTIVTGVKIIVNNTAEDAATAVSEYTTGTDGYMLTIEGNPLISADNVASILSALGSRLIGMTYRKGMVSHINDPRLEAGDVFVFTDHKGHVYPMICSETSFTVGEYQHTTSASETPARNSAQRYSESTRNTVKIFEAVGREKNARETAVDDLQDQIDNAPGLYMTTQTEGGATVYLLHNKPTVAASDIIWKMSSAAVGVSTNGGQSYNAGLTADGTAIVQRLFANAIIAGILQSSDYSYTSGIYADAGMIVDLDNEVIRATNVAMYNGSLYAQAGDIGGWTIDDDGLYCTFSAIYPGTTSERTYEVGFRVNDDPNENFLYTKRTWPDAPQTYLRELDMFHVNNMGDMLGRGRMQWSGAAYFGLGTETFFQNLGHTAIEDGVVTIVGPSTGGGILAFSYGGGGTSATLQETSAGVLTLDGTLVVGKTTDTVSRGVTSRNSLGNVGLTVGTDGAHGLYSGTKGGFLLYATKDDNSTNSTLYVPRPLRVTGELVATTGIGVNKTTQQEAKAGFWANSAGNLYLTGDTSTGSYIYFYFNKAVSATSYIREESSNHLYTNAYLRAKLYNGTVGQVVGSVPTDGNQIAYFSSNATTLFINGQHGTTGSTFANKNIPFSSSDIRLKENIKDTEVEALPVINRMRVREFDWKDGRDDKHQIIGVVADELEEIDEHLAVGGGYDEDGHMNVKSVDNFYLTGYLLKAVQELSAEVKSLKAEIERLKGGE